MKTKKEIQDLREKWLNNCKDYDKIVDTLKDYTGECNDESDDEFNSIKKKLERLNDAIKQDLKNYHDACMEYLDDVIKTLDPKSKEWLKGIFYRDCFNTNDWDNAINHLDELSSIIKHFS